LITGGVGLTGGMVGLAANDELEFVLKHGLEFERAELV
jgi:hypothetical protein